MSESATVAQQLDMGRTLHRRGDLREAEQHYLKVLALEPANTEALKLLAAMALARENLDRAAELAGSALSIRPDSGEYLHLLGQIKLRQGDFRNAAQYLSRSLNSNVPERGQALLDLSACFAKLKAWPESLAAASSALEAEPGSVVAHRLAGHASFALERYAEAIAHFDRVLAADATQHSLWHFTSVSALRLQRAAEAHARAVKACRLVPENAEYAFQRRAAGAAAVPDWHFNMVNDRPRNAAFAAAIAQVVRPAHLVLEIGTGSGLLAMLAARGEAGEARASRVVTCEANPLLAQTATDIVAANGLSKTIRVVAKPSTELRVGVDLEARADVLICEIFSVQVISEGVLPSLEDAKARLLTAGATIIPSAAIARAALVAGEALSRRVRTGSVLGFDLSRLNEFAPTIQFLPSEQSVTLLSEPTDLFRFDLAHQERFPPEKRMLSFAASADGLCEGVVQWLRLELCTGVDFENPPGSPQAEFSRHWHPVFYPFVEPVAVVAGQTVNIRASHNRSGLRIELANAR